MKKKHIIFGVFSMLAILFGSCSTEVDLYADFKDITIVYGLLDIDNDTNFIKINRAFLGYGDANEVALIADSCNYPGKLDCKIIEYRAGMNSETFEKTQEFPLDTTTIHNKDLGLFYAPDQLVYYTTGKIRPNTDRYRYRYDLEIDRGDTVLTASTDVVGGSRFSIVSSVMNFSSYTEYGKLRWLECPNSFIYDVTIKFHYTEVDHLTNDSVDRCAVWYLGSHPAATTNSDNGIYYINYKSSSFFGSIANEIGDDTLNFNLERIFFEPSIEIEIIAGGEELYNYILVNGSNSSIVQTIPDYTNIHGGYGVFSSRSKKTARAKMNSQTMMELLARTNWNFRQAQ